MGSALWRLEGQLMVTVVVKATFELVPDAAMRLAPPLPVRRTDEHDAGQVTRGAIGACEIAPLLQRVDVLLTGHAYPQRGASRAVVLRLAIRSSRGVLLDKSLVARNPELSGARIAIDHAQAYGGIGYPDNPLGVGFGATAGVSPRVLYVDGPEDRTAGLGPIPASFPVRRRLLPMGRRSPLEDRVAEIPLDFDWRYFQAAPEDQRINRLQGNEWLVLESLHPAERRMHSQLPGADAVVRLYGAERAGVTDRVPLRIDMLHIEPDADRCSLLWRGSFPIEREDLLAELVAAAGLEWPGEPTLWPGSEDDLEVSSAPPGAEGDDTATTRVMVPKERAVAHAATLAIDPQARPIDEGLKGTLVMHDDAEETMPADPHDAK
jgi:hypothetical protein